MTVHREYPKLAIWLLREQRRGRVTRICPSLHLWSRPADRGSGAGAGLMTDFQC